MATITDDEIIRLVRTILLRIHLDEKQGAGAPSITTGLLEAKFRSVEHEDSDVGRLFKDKELIGRLSEALQSSAGGEPTNVSDESAKKLQDAVLKIKSLQLELKEARDRPETLDIFGPVDILSLQDFDPIIDFAGVLKKSLATTDSEYLEGTSVPVNTIWFAVREEVHELLCTKSAKYRHERAVFEITAFPAIGALSALLMATYALSAAVSGGIASLALLVPFKLVKGVWCSIYEKSNVHKDEMEVIRKVSERPRKKRVE